MSVFDAATAVVVGSGGIGSALLAQLRSDGRYAQVLALGRSGDIALDLTDEASVAHAAAQLATAIATASAPLRLVMVASGVLQGPGVAAEKSWRDIDAAQMARAFAVNAIGPALLAKHLLPLLPREGRSVFAALSARVGSIGDNRLGGWYSYRASKAALNQLLRCAAIELRRSRPQALCVALHPGTVATPLSQPFRKSGLAVQTPPAATAQLLALVERLQATDSGGFFDVSGQPVPW